MRSSVLACYGNFYRSVRHSAALEVKTLACLAAADVRSTTGSNLSNLSREFGVDPSQDASICRSIILDRKSEVPAMDRWRIPCLAKYLADRFRMKLENEDTSELDDLILSLVRT